MGYGKIKTENAGPGVVNCIQLLKVCFSSQY